MKDKTKLKYLEIFELKEYRIKFLLNQKAQLLWQSESDKKPKELSKLPWEFQLPFYLKFLHDDNLSNRFKGLSVLGAIDVYVKSSYYNERPLNI